MAATTRLCDLITGHLLPYLESNTAWPNKETEKDLLLSLTRVRREIQQMITKSSNEADEMVEGSYANPCCHQSLQDIFKGEERCLCNIISVMVAFLSADSHFVRHVTGTILLSISHFLIKAILMTRLSFHMLWKNPYPESWLKILCQFFGEILHQSIPVCDAGSENCLESSPFFVSAPDGDKSYHRHLQRQVIFLLFKCSLTIANGDEACKECSCTKEDISSSFGLQICRMHCQLGLNETFAWLERCCDLDKITESKNYSESCSTFASSFLQFYMEEDDMLFKMLLQLLDVPFSKWQKEDSPKDEYIEENKDILCHYSSIFCPIRLFHLFLLLLHYDHLVLIDYLISKDTGIHCLQYLMRCLRVIRMSWPAFEQFSVSGNGHRYQKRRKITHEEGPAPLSSTTAAFRRQIMRRKKKHQSTNEPSNSHTFEKARQCLLSLKNSLEELQRKSLFPYNPKPLLKSLSRFQELCMTNSPLQT